MKILPKIPPNKEFIKFCNSLKCPLCKSQLDGNINPKLAKLYCVSNNEEYTSIWEPNLTFPNYEKIIFYYGDFSYEISSAWNISSFEPNTWHTTIDRLDMNINKLYRSNNAKRLFNHYGERLLFFRKRMEEKEFLNKLKTYQTFL